MRLFALLPLALIAACGGQTAEDGPRSPWPESGCPPSHELRGGRCTMREIHVPGGGFLMGRGFCPKSGSRMPPPDLECLLADEPHWVEVAPFWVDATLYTWTDYTHSYKEGGLGLPHDDDARCPSREIQCAAPLAYAPVGGSGWGLPGNPPGNLSSNDSACDPHGKRAIREAEWEWLATWGGTRTYPWGEAEPTCERGQISSDCELVNPIEWDMGQDVPISKVASHLPTPEGVYDLTGGGGESVMPSPDSVYTDGYPNPVQKPSECPSGQDYCGMGWVTGHRGGSVDLPPRRFEGAFRGTSRDGSPGAPPEGIRCVRPALQ